MKKIYFVHVPKTAGNSVRSALRDQKNLMNAANTSDRVENKKQREHKFAVDDASRLGHPSFTTSYFSNYTKDRLYKKSEFAFTVVRNPFDLLVSYYMHSSKAGDDGWANVNKYHKISTFKDFVMLYCTIESDKWHVPLLNKNLFSQLFNEEGECMVKYALFFENLNENLRELVNHCREEKDKDKKRKVKLKTLNKSSRRTEGSYKKYYDEEMVKKVQEKCAVELEMFGYRFSGKPEKRSILDISKYKLEV